jgi:hypothetical protein
MILAPKYSQSTTATRVAHYHSSSYSTVISQQQFCPLFHVNYHFKFSTITVLVVDDEFTGNLLFAKLYLHILTNKLVHVSTLRPVVTFLSYLGEICFAREDFRPL